MGASGADPFSHDSRSLDQNFLDLGDDCLSPEKEALLVCTLPSRQKRPKPAGDRLPKVFLETHPRFCRSLMGWRQAASKHGGRQVFEPLSAAARPPLSRLCAGA